MRLVAAEHRSRKVEAARIAGARRLLDRRTAGKAQPQELRCLVEGFAQRVVDGRAEALIVADAAHDQELRVAARHEQ